MAFSQGEFTKNNPILLLLLKKGRMSKPKTTMKNRFAMWWHSVVRQPRNAADKCTKLDIYFYCSLAFGQPRHVMSREQRVDVAFSRPAMTPNPCKPPLFHIGLAAVTKFSVQSCSPLSNFFWLYIVEIKKHLQHFECPFSFAWFNFHDLSSGSTL